MSDVESRAIKKIIKKTFFFSANAFVKGLIGVVLFG